MFKKKVYNQQVLNQLVKDRSEDVFLVGDIGATHSRFALFYINENQSSMLLAVYWMPTGCIQNFTDVVKLLLHAIKKEYCFTIKKACFGAPGIPTYQKHFIQAAHMHFSIDASHIKSNTDLHFVWVLNDVELVAYGLHAMPADNIIVLQKGHAPYPQNKAIINIGTGLGTVLMVWNEAKQLYFCVSSAGECQDFAADEEDLVMLSFCKKVTGLKRIDWGTMLSGSTGYGLSLIYQFVQLSDDGSTNITPTEAKKIVECYQDDDQHAKKAVDIYMYYVAKWIRNVCYYAQALGGVYICGGAVTNNMSMFKADAFVKLIVKDDINYSFLKQIPIFLINDEYAALYGAAYYLSHIVQEKN